MRKGLIKRLLGGALAVSLATAGVIEGHKYHQKKDFEKFQDLFQEYVDGADSDEVWAIVIAKNLKKQELIKKGLIKEESGAFIVDYAPDLQGPRQDFKDSLLGHTFLEGLMTPLTPLVKAPFTIPYNISSGEIYKSLDEKEKKSIIRNYADEIGKFPYYEGVARIRLENFMKKRNFNIESSIFDSKDSLRKCLGYKKSSELCDDYGCKSPRIKELAKKVYSKKKCLN